MNQEDGGISEAKQIKAAPGITTCQIVSIKKYIWNSKPVREDSQINFAVAIWLATGKLFRDY